MSSAHRWSDAAASCLAQERQWHCAGAAVPVLGVSKTAQSSMDLHFKSAEEIARLIQQFLSAGVQRGSPLLAHLCRQQHPRARQLSGDKPPYTAIEHDGRI